VGLNTVAVVVGEEPETIEEVYEPFLIQNGFLKRTPRGREVTARVYKYFNLDPKKPGAPQADLFQGDTV
jgi:Holliday junction DNA helicase RuvB